MFGSIKIQCRDVKPGTDKFDRTMCPDDLTFTEACHDYVPWCPYFFSFL